MLADTRGASICVHVAHVVSDPRFLRPAEVDHLVGDASKARDALAWEPRTSFRELVGLINAHVHLDLIGHSDYDEWHHKYVPGSPGYAQIVDAGARQLVMGGVTTAIDLAGHPDALKAAREIYTSAQTKTGLIIK